MCSVNDKKREAIRLRINGYNNTKSNLKEVKNKVEKALYENIEALSYAKCVTRNLSEINLGGNKTIDSVNECKNAIDTRIDFYNEQLKNIDIAIKELETAIELAEEEYKNIPENCGICSECSPSKPTKVT